MSRSFFIPFFVVVLLIAKFGVAADSGHPSLQEQKAILLSQINSAASQQNLDQNLTQQARLLLEEPASILGAMGDGALITALGASIAAMWTAEQIMGPKSELGGGIVKNLFAFGAALGALPLNLITIPFSPIGALIGGIFGVKEKVKDNRQANAQSQEAWKYTRFVYELILESQIHFLNYSREERIGQLENLLGSIRQNSQFFNSNLASADFIIYDSKNQEDRARAEVITAILNTSTFRKQDKTPLTKEELKAFLGHLITEIPSNISKNQVIESALLSIRFMDHYIRGKHMWISVADVVSEMVERGE